MINILSVDFDWIMEPCIELYNNSIKETTPLDDVLKTSPGINIHPDYKKYYILVKLLNNICKDLPKENIQIVDHHPQIVDCIINWNINDKYRIYNIDHHHDCGYGVDDSAGVMEQGLQCGNWVHYCTNLRKYVWINNKNSDTILPEEITSAIPNYHYTYDINILNYVKFDYVFLCLSPAWIPEGCWPLFDALALTLK